MMAEGYVNEAGEVKWTGTHPCGVEVRGFEDGVMQGGSFGSVLVVSLLCRVFTLHYTVPPDLLSGVKRKRFFCGKLFSSAFDLFHDVQRRLLVFFAPYLTSSSEYNTKSVVFSDWRHHTQHHFYLSLFILLLWRKLHCVVELLQIFQWFWHCVIAQFIHLVYCSQIQGLNKSCILSGIEWAMALCVFVTNEKV